ncbi:MAG: glycoside hydrolase family 11 protein [Spirochaetales bacterium]|nr:glycoside hydrolase family 11 protein [Spirochaetales bacterium]
MKLKMGLILAILMCFSVLTVAAQTITSNQTGTHDGYFYFLWTDGVGSVTMTLGSGGNYSVIWSNCGNFVCGKGWRTGSDRTVNYSGSFNSGSNGLLSLYGWTQDELIEYYVVENYGSWTPPGVSPSGMVSSDGGIYNLYRTRVVNQLSIYGFETFYRYWSVRTQRRSNGTVTFANHINAWKNLGWDLGSSWAFQLMATEGIESSGSADITIDDGSSTTTTTTTSAGPTPTPVTTTTTTTSSGTGQTCSPAVSRSVPFTQNGPGEYCFSTTSNIKYINSWNMVMLTVNGVDFKNRWASGSSLPAKIDGKYYIVYKGYYGWSHFEAR